MLAVALAALPLAGCAPAPRWVPARPVAAEVAPTARPSVAPSSVAPSSVAPRPAARVPVRPAGTVADRLHTVPATSRQLIVVQSDGYLGTTATLETFQRVGGVWRPVLGPMTARIGRAGFTDHKVEGDG